MKGARLCWLVAVLCGSGVVPPSSAAQDLIAPEGATAQTLEQVQTQVSDSLFDMTDRVDEFFDDVRTAEQREDDWFRIGAGFRLSTDGKFEVSQRVRASFNLSAFSRRLKLIVGGANIDADKETERELEFRNPDSQNRLNEEVFGQKLGGSGLLGLRYQLLDSDYKRIVVQGGYRLRGGLQPFSELRASIRRRLTEHWAFEPTQFFFWDGDDGFGEKTRAEFTRDVFEGAYLRLRSEALWSEVSEGLDLSQECGLYREIGVDSYIGVIGFVDVDAYPAVSADVYRFSNRVKTLIFSNWLYGELEPFLEFTDSNSHDPALGFVIRFDAKFSRDDVP